MYCTGYQKWLELFVYAFGKSASLSHIGSMAYTPLAKPLPPLPLHRWTGNGSSSGSRTKLWNLGSILPKNTLVCKSQIWFPAGTKRLSDANHQWACQHRSQHLHHCTAPGNTATITSTMVIVYWHFFAVCVPFWTISNQLNWPQGWYQPNPICHFEGRHWCLEHGHSNINLEKISARRTPRRKGTTAVWEQCVLKSDPHCNWWLGEARNQAFFFPRLTC